MKLKHLKNKLIKLKCKDFDINKIPGGHYCANCPYKKYIKIRFKKFAKYQVQNGENWTSILVPSGWRRAQYCAVLGKFLSIQDSIKDCDYNISEEYYE